MNLFEAHQEGLYYGGFMFYLRRPDGRYAARLGVTLCPTQAVRFGTEEQAARNKRKRRLVAYKIITDKQILDEFFNESYIEAIYGVDDRRSARITEALAAGKVIVWDAMGPDTIGYRDPSRPDSSL